MIEAKQGAILMALFADESPRLKCKIRARKTG
jgi:hypothetical protein